jgi:hypothetical protein
MTEQPQSFRITRETLRDGSLIEAARKRMPPGTRVRGDAEIESCLDAYMVGIAPIASGSKPAAGRPSSRA